MSSTEFLITLTYEPRVITLACAGDLDIATAGKLRDAIDICVEDEPAWFTLDTQGVSLLTSSGIEVLIHAVKECRARNTHLDLRLNHSARRVLDLVGLWWLGVIDDGPAIDESFKTAMRVYRELQFGGQIESEAS